MSGEKVAYDVLVWATGVKGCNFDSGHQIAVDAKGKIPVNQFFQTADFPEVFGDGPGRSARFRERGAGAGSLWTNSGELVVGYAGAGNSLTI